MTFIPIFDLSVTAEKTDLLARLGSYFYYPDFGTITDASLQITINEASQRIYEFTGYYPKQTAQTINVDINPRTGKGNIGFKLPTNLVTCTTTDKRFDGEIIDLDYVYFDNNGGIFVNTSYYDSTANLTYYPNPVSITIDYGFTKSTSLPEKLKMVCTELIIHYLNRKLDQASMELTNAQNGDERQQYNNPKKVELSILKPLRLVKL
jgi:hypothetical protein